MLSALDTPRDNLYGVCFTQAVTLQFTQIAQLGWISVIALNLYLVVSNGEAPDQYEVVYHVFVWFSATVLTILPVTYNAYGHTVLWCWLILQDKQIFRMYIFFGPLLVVFISVSVLYFLIWRAVKTRIGIYVEWNRKDKLAALTQRLIVFPLLLGFYIFPFINFWAEANKNFLVLFILQSIFAPLVGLTNVIVYALDFDTRRMWKQYFAKYGCCYQLEDIHNSTNEDIFFDDEHTSLVNSLPKSYKKSAVIKSNVN